MVCVIFFSCVYYYFGYAFYFLTGGVSIARGVGSGGGIYLYRFGYFEVVADVALSVMRGRSPITHSLGWRGGGVEIPPKSFKVKPLGIY